MAVAEKAAVIKADYQAQLDKLEEVKASLSEKIMLVDAMVAEHEAEVLAAQGGGSPDQSAEIESLKAQLAEAQAQLAADAQKDSELASQIQDIAQQIK